MPRNSTSASKKHFPTALEILVLRQLIKNQHFEGKTPGKNELVRAFGQNAYRLFNRKRFAGGSFQQNSFVELLEWVKFQPKSEENPLIEAFQEVCKWPGEEHATVPSCFPEALPKAWHKDLQAAKEKILELHFGYSAPKAEVTTNTQEEDTKRYSEREFKKLSNLLGSYKMYVGNRRERGTGTMLVTHALIFKDDEKIKLRYEFVDDKVYEGVLYLKEQNGYELHTELQECNRPNGHSITMRAILRTTQEDDLAFLMQAQCKSKNNTVITYEELFVKSKEKLSLGTPKVVDFDDLQKEELPYELLYLLKASYIESPSDFHSKKELKDSLKGFAKKRREDRKEMVNIPPDEISNIFKEERIDFLVYAFGRDDSHLKRASLSLEYKYGRLVAELKTYQSKYENDYSTFKDGVLRLVFHKVGKPSSMLTFVLNMKKETANIYTVGFLSIRNSTEKPLIGLDLLVRKDYAEKKDLGLKGAETARIQKEDLKNDFEKLVYDFLTIPKFLGKELIDIQNAATLEAEVAKTNAFHPGRFYSFKKASLPKGAVGEYYFYYPNPVRPNTILCRRLVVEEFSVKLCEEFSGEENNAKEIVFEGQGVEMANTNHCSIFLKGSDENPIEIRLHLANRASKNKETPALIWAFSEEKQIPIALPAYLVSVKKGETQPASTYKERVETHFQKVGTRLLMLS